MDGKRKRWLTLISDGDLEDYLDSKEGDMVVAISWSGHFYTSGSFTNKLENCGFVDIPAS